jgi:hypothetical protein
MIINRAPVARVVPLTAPILGACLLVLTITLTGCGTSETRDVLAYDACAARHPQELAICEAPRQAFELDPTAFQATADSVSPASGSYPER